MIRRNGEDIATVDTNLSGTGTMLRYDRDIHCMEYRSSQAFDCTHLVPAFCVTIIIVRATTNPIDDGPGIICWAFSWTTPLAVY